MISMVVEALQIFAVLLQLRPWNDSQALTMGVRKLLSELWVRTRRALVLALCQYEVSHPVKDVD